MDWGGSYRAYRKEVYAERMARSLRSGILVVISLNTAFFALDFFAYPDEFARLGAARIALNLSVLAIYLASFRWSAERLAVAGCLATGLGLVGIISFAGGTASAYAPGLTLLFLGMPVLLPFSVRESAWIVGSLLAAFAVAPFAMNEDFGGKQYLLHIFFPAAAAIECVASCALLDRLRFSDFLQRRELEKARDELKELDRAKSRFTANLHHELRTPLTLMMAPLEGIQSGEFGEVSPIVSQALRTMHVNGLRLLKLINNLLDLAKIESNELEVRRVPLDLERLARDVVDGARSMAVRKGVELSLAEVGPTAGLHADPDALDKVLVNLVGNALKFTDSGGQIVVGVAQGPEGVHLTVRDTGIGIPKEKLDRVFDRFAQVDDSATRKHEGTGIGLSLVKELVELHGGRVWAESGGAGQGTTMHVALPWGESDAAADEEVLATDAGHSLTLGRSVEAMEAELEHHGQLDVSERLVELERNVERHEGRTAQPGVEVLRGGHGDDVPEVLVAEDNFEMRRLLAHLLGRHLRVRTAPNGRVALEAARECVPDLVLTDVMMPEMSGIELCRALKDGETTRHVPVVLVTSKAEREMKIEGLELGADDYVTKPFHPRELLARVNALLRVARLQADLSERNAALEAANRDLAHALQELKEAEVQLVQVERLTAVGELAAGVAHEVNNPLNFARNSLAALRTYVDDVRELVQAIAEVDPADPEKLPQQLEDLERRKAELGFEEIADELAELVNITTEGLDRTQRLVGDLRDFAAPRAGAAGIADLAQCLESTLALLKHAAQRAGVQVESDVPVGLPRVVGDPQALNQVFLNLLKNALEALDGAGGGTVRVRVREEPERGTVRVEVEDDGPGIEASVRERLFEPFVTSKPAGRGTGLGLSISRRIVNEHGGEISVASEVGSGTCFTVRLRAEGEDAD